LSTKPNNTTEWTPRRITVGHHGWLFVGSARGDERLAAIYTQINAAKLNGIDPQA
jgi:transposase